MKNKIPSRVSEGFIKKVVYNLVDRSILLSFIGGVLLGIVPFFLVTELFFVSGLCVLFSLVIFFGARYSGLKFLFIDGDEEEEDMMTDEIGILPNYSEPNIEIRELISPDGVFLSLIVKDYKSFIDSLMSIKEGGSKTFTKYGPRRETTIKVVNMDNQSYGKRLEE